MVLNCFSNTLLPVSLFTLRNLFPHTKICHFVANSYELMYNTLYASSFSENNFNVKMLALYTLKYDNLFWCVYR